MGNGKVLLMKNCILSKEFSGHKLIKVLIVLFLLMNSLITAGQASIEEPPEEYRGEPVLLSDGSIGNAGIQEESFGIAWGDPDGEHSTYAWPFTFVQMGHAIQSYQNYGSGTSGAYFHHGIDMIAPDGTRVYTRSGGKVVNIENYQPGNDLYWEVAILDAEGYVWQYHHIDRRTIPQAIFTKFAEWQANPQTGGYVPPNTHIGDIVYWTVTSFGYRFNHIHLNILAAGDIYLNPMEFHTPIEDNQAPEIQAIGLLNGNTLVSGNVATGNYGMYVRARDLYKSTVYYLPPYKTEFSIDGGEWITVWEFHDFPGGFNDKTYVNDFFVPGATCGNYTCRDFYIDLGFTTSGQRAFPSEPGEHTIDVRVWDYAGNSDTESFTWLVALSIPDNGCNSGNGVTRTFTIDQDLVVTDVNLGLNISHASRGQVRVTLKSPSDTTATTIVGNINDNNDNYDVWVDDSSNNPINDGDNDNVGAPYFDRTAGPTQNGSLDSFNNKPAYGVWTVFICDNTSETTGSVNIVALEVVGYPSDNNPPIADPKAITTDEDASVSVTLTGSDPDGDPLTFAVVSQPQHGVITGTSPNLVYTPAQDYNGSDSFTYKANDGKVDSAPAAVTITINPINDAPVANDQSVNTQYSLPVEITLVGIDVDGDDLTYSVVAQPAHGVLSGDAPVVVYTPDPDYVGADSFTFKVNDGVFDSNAATVSIAVSPPGPVTIFWDDFESDLGWVRNPLGTDTANSGLWERGIPELVTYRPSGIIYTTQLGTTVSGVNNLVTGRLAGSDAGSHDVDDGVTSIRSPEIDLPADAELTLSFYYYLAHLNNATNADYFRLKIVDNSKQVLFEKLASASYLNATWNLVSIDVSQFAGQTIQLLFEAADEGAGSLIEAAVDDVLIQGSITNFGITAHSQRVTTGTNNPVDILLSGAASYNFPLRFDIVDGPEHGTLAGFGKNRVYIPDDKYIGPDQFTFTTSLFQRTSEPAEVTIYVYDPTSAGLLSFEGVHQDGVNVITWETVSQESFVTFNLYRSDSVDGEKVKLNIDPIKSDGTTFEYIDKAIVIGNQYYYWLEASDFSGDSENYGPVEVKSELQLFIPMIIN